MSIKFWQRTPDSIENTGTFAANTCLSCHRFWYPLTRPGARPICIMNSYDMTKITKHYNKGHPYIYNLPEWDPLGCSYWYAK